MTEFEKNMLAIMQEMKSDITGIKSEIKTINNRLDKVESRLDNIESDIEDIKENTAITRTAANYNGEKIEELTTELQKANIIAWYIKETTIYFAVFFVCTSYTLVNAVICHAVKSSIKIILVMLYNAIKSIIDSLNSASQY